jgi:hypothetical protein
VIIPLLASSVPTPAILLAVLVFVLFYPIFRFRTHRFGTHRSNILDLDYGRWLAELCETPRTTDYLRGKYEEWKSRSRVAVIGGYDFEDYMKQLEKQGYLIYQNEKWHVTDKALDYIDKYHGD